MLQRCFSLRNGMEGERDWTRELDNYAPRIERRRCSVVHVGQSILCGIWIEKKGSLEN